jgi:N-methylhydantoinase A
MNLRISTDIGGTFTDLVCVDEKGELKVSKASTTPGNYVDWIFAANAMIMNKTDLHD